MRQMLVRAPVVENPRMRLIPILTLALMLLGAGAACAAEADSAELQFFESKVRPLLVERCYKCHATTSVKLKGGLLLDSADGLAKGGENGAAVVAGHPEQSRLIEAIGYGNVDLQMPPKGKLSDEQIADLTKWVKIGAVWPKEATAKPVAVAGVTAFDLQKRKAEHWAWQPVKSQTPPAVANGAFVKDPIDQFILAKLEAKGLAAAPPADRRVLLRRAYFDLIGLPPSPQAVDEFLADNSPNAFEKVVDKLLASPQFGERWARHWLDLVRYAESYGHEFDFPIEHAWQYRDYVIRALNSDVPYNQLVTEHIAGDLLDKPRIHPAEGFNESIIGSGFWYFTEQTHSPVDVRQHQSDRVDNQIDTMGKAFLGLTLGCARCHDHKFDAISQKDVYSLWGFAESSRRQVALLDPQGKIAAAVGQLKAVQSDGDKLLADAAPAPDRAAHDVAEYLLAVRELATTPSVNAEEVAQLHGLDLARLKQWQGALADKATADPAHPLFAWANLSKLAADAKAEAFTEARTRAVAATADASKRATESAARTLLFKDFHDGNFNGWFTTGWSFGDRPTQVQQLDLKAKTLRAVDAGVASSGSLSPRLKGVLRSPTFTLDCDQILYHVAGKGCSIHLVIDGYMMDQFQPLLFGGALFKVENEQFMWQRQGGDIGRYKGQSAYIEIVDDGDGWIGVDQIRFANKDAPPPSVPPSPLNTVILNDASITSIQSLSASYGKLFAESLTQWHAGKSDAAHGELIKWALEHNLLDVDAATTKVAALAAGLTEKAGHLSEPMRVIAATDGTGIDEHVFVRGSPKAVGVPAPRRFLEAIAGSNQKAISSGSGRLELAQRVTDPANPLFSRVIVNRLWHHLFGVGIVASTDNFGVLGERPTHPELLDHLATRFVNDGWSMKKVIRAIMLSSTYQMSSKAGDAKAEELDPDNRLLHRARLRRLEGEAIRDEILSVSGRLDPSLYGNSVNVFLTSFMEGRGRPGSGPLDGGGRRSIYLSVHRNFLPPMMLAFDTPIPFSCMGRRSVSNVPAQALIMMNDPFVVQQAQLWAKRTAGAADVSPAKRIEKMYVTAFARPASEDEIRIATAFLDQQGEALGLNGEQRLSDERVWADLAHALMNTKEFIFLE